MSDSKRSHSTSTSLGRLPHKISSPIARLLSRSSTLQHPLFRSIALVPSLSMSKKLKYSGECIHPPSLCSSQLTHMPSEAHDHTVLRVLPIICDLPTLADCDLKLHLMMMITEMVRQSAHPDSGAQFVSTSFHVQLTNTRTQDFG